MSPAVPSLASRAAVSAVRTLLDESGYREDRICLLLGTSSLAEALCKSPLVLARRARGNSPLEILVRLFLGGFELARHDLVTALGAAPVHALEETRLIEPAAAGVRSTVQLSSMGSLVLASDRGDRHVQGAADFVLGPGPSARLLADLTIRRPVPSILDLCCGSGVLGLLATAHSDRVVAADLSPRCVSFTRFNAGLNGLDTVETAEGDLFGPVRDRRFDLILCNPPFVISPTSTFLYRDGGSQICERIVREAPDHLTETGCLEMLCNWPEEAGSDWRASVGRWFDRSDCDVWVLRHGSLAAPDYAAVWLSQEPGDGQIAAGRFAEWMTHLDSLGIESVGTGLVVMRPARGHRPWREIRDAPPIAAGAAGNSIARTLAARDLAAGLRSQEEMLDVRLCPSPDIEQLARENPTGEGWDRVGLELRLTRGLRFSARVDPVAAALIGLLDGRRTVREAVSVFAERHRLPEEAFLEDLPRALGHLLHLGLLLPADEC
jgi:SAM-dependent methyltransferase